MSNTKKDKNKDNNLFIYKITQNYFAFLSWISDLPKLLVNDVLLFESSPKDDLLVSPTKNAEKAKRRKTIPPIRVTKKW